MKFLTGTVYSKALAIFLAAALGLLGAVVALSQLIILREFNQSEEREMKAMLQRFSFVIGREMRPLEAAVGEMAKSPVVIDSLARNPGTASETRLLADSNLDAIALFETSGNLLRSSVSPKLSTPLAAEIEKVFQQMEEGDFFASKETGFVGVGNGLALISHSPVLVKSGASKGFLLGGKLLGQETFGFLEGLFSATIRFHPFRNTLVNETTGREMADLLNAQEIVIEAENDGQIVGYRLLEDIAGKPIGYVSISQPRPLRQEGLRAIQVFLTGICLAGGALVIVVWILLDRTILARIKDLTRKLDAEKRSGRLPVRLDFRGEDELGILARSIEGLAVLLQNTQSLYRSILEDQTELICRFDSDFRLSFANAIFLRLFHIESSTLNSRSLPDFLPGDAWTAFRRQFQQLSIDQPLLNHTHEIRLGESQVLWFRSTLRRHFSDDGTDLGGQWVLAEITAQIAAQKKMIESERRFRRLFESASDGLLLIEGSTLIISDINPSLCRMLMVTGSEIMGQRLDLLPTFAPCVDAVRSFRKNGVVEALRSECRLQRADDTSLFVELRCGGYDVDGAEYVQLSFRNISERVLGEQELRRLSAKLLRLQDEERRRIARELHDSTAQNLSALEMNMSLLEPLVEKSNPRAARIVAETRQIAGECSREIRNISYLLHPPLIDEVGLAFAIKWFADGFSKRTGILATVEIDDSFPRLASEMEMPLFRIVQEAMTNIYRHSGADRAWVKLRSEGRLIFVEIRDNGRGFDDGVLTGAGLVDDRRMGVGLAGMKERLANFGGRLEIESSPLGATLTIRFVLGVGEAASIVGPGAAGDQNSKLAKIP